MRPSDQAQRGTSTPLFAALVFFATTTLTLVLLMLLREPAPDPGPTLDDPLDLYLPREPGAPHRLTAEEKLNVGLFRSAAPSVVHVDASGEALESMRADHLPPGVGSGFVWSLRGHIVTSLHVVDGRGEVNVILADGSKWQAMFVGSNPDYDLAVLFVEAPAERLHPIELGHSTRLQVGQKVFAIGNPFGLDHTLTVGVISGLERSIQGTFGGMLLGMVQTDAAINPGNSGGPLLNSSGQLIGINTAVPADSPASAGVGFAVPVDAINRVVPDLLARGFEPWPELGLVLAPDFINLELLRTSGWMDETGLDFGVIVLEVREDSPAQAAGMLMVGAGRDPVSGGSVAQVRDVIVGVDGARLTTRDELSAVLGRKRPGDAVRLGLRRAGQPLEVELVAVERR